MVTGRAALPPFATVTVCGALSEFFAMLPNANAVGDSVYDAVFFPVPLSATVCMPAPPPAFTVTVAVFAPPEVGAKMTLMVQAELGGTALPQVLVCENSARLGPAIAMLDMGSAALLAFVTVTDCGVLLVLVAMVPKASAAGETV